MHATRNPVQTAIAVADIPEWSAGYSYDGSDARFLREVRPGVRRRGYLTVAEFRDICYWKTPRSQSRCRQNTADDVRVLTQAALATRDEALKMDLLRRLSGVEWPTASTPAALLRRSTVPDPRLPGLVVPRLRSPTALHDAVLAELRRVYARAGSSQRTPDPDGGSRPVAVFEGAATLGVSA
jgi:hypothetical protein